MDFDNLSFIIVCFRYILFHLNPFFLERKFNNEYNGECARMLWTYLVPNEFYIFICKHDIFKYQNVYEIINDFIAENKEHFSKLKEDFGKNPQVSQYDFATLFPKYFCRVDDYDVKSKVAFDTAYSGYKNEQENLFVKK